MDPITRSGITFDNKQLKQFDAHIKKKGCTNRSEAIRDLIRDALLTEQRANPETAMIATLTIIYDHEEHHVQEALTHIQHHHPDIIRSTLHIHVDEHNCLEVLVLQGKVKHITKFANEITAQKGVKNGKLVLTNTT